MTLTRVPVVTDIRDFYAAATVGRQMQPGSEGDEAKPFFLSCPLSTVGWQWCIPFGFKVEISRFEG